MPPRDVASSLAKARAVARNVAKARLTDMQVFEVSLVDRAANSRQFVLRKRATDAITNIEKRAEEARARLREMAQ